MVVQSPNGDKWTMSFVMPSKYGSNLPIPKDQSVNIKEVPRKIIAVTAFSGTSYCFSSKKVCNSMKNESIISSIFFLTTPSKCLTIYRLLCSYNLNKDISNLALKLCSLLLCTNHCWDYENILVGTFLDCCHVGRGFAV